MKLNRIKTRALALAAAMTLIGTCLVPSSPAGEFAHSKRPEIAVDCRFPGGNILLDGIEGNTVTLHQDLRDTQGDWFDWYFRVRGAAGRTPDFKFTRGNPIGVRSPAVSTDGGKNWQWLEKETVRGPIFRYTFPSNAREVRFCFAIPYFEANLKEFLSRHAADRHLKADTLIERPQGPGLREVPQRLDAS